MLVEEERVFTKGGEQGAVASEAPMPSRDQLFKKISQER
jgi:hypothetical protein